MTHLIPSLWERCKTAGFVPQLVAVEHDQDSNLSNYSDTCRNIYPPRAQNSCSASV